MQVLPGLRKLFSFAVSMGFVLVLLATVAVSATSAAPASRGYIVVLKDDVAHPANLAHRHEENRDAEIGHIYGVAIKGYSADLTPGELAAIRKDPNVDYVEPDRVIHVRAQYPSTAIPRVGALGNPQLDIDEKDDAPIDADIAIIDSGIAPHRDLNIAGRTDCTNFSYNGGCQDGYGVPFKEWHGTHVAGIAAARDNAEGVVGSAPGARLWSVRVVDDESYGSLSEEIAGVNWVTAHASTIEVANMSIGCEFCDLPQALHEALTASINAGVVYTVAAGNHGQNALKEGVDPQTIVVSAITDFDGAPGGKGTDWCNQWNEDDELAGYSNFGSVIDIAAPGSCIRSTYLNGEYAWWFTQGSDSGPISGTSMAAPLVAGAAAVLASQSNPQNRTDVEGISNSLRWGSYNYADTSGDGVKEPLLSMSSPFVRRSAAPTQEAPSVTTGGVENVTTGSAKLLGWLNPNGASTTFYFQYGKTAAYGTNVPTTAASAGSGTSAFLASYDISGLEPLTTYHYRLVASNSAGTTTGTDQTFTTTAHPAPAAVISGGQPYVYYGLANGEMKQLRFNGASWVGSNFGTSVALTGTPSAVAMSDGSRRIFYRGSDGALHEWWINGTNWSEVQWGSDGAMGSDPTAVKAPDGTRYVYFRSTDGSMRQWRIASPTDWNEATYGATGALAGTPSAVAMADGSRRVFYRGTDGALHEWWINGASWNLAQWGSASTMASNPSAVVTANGTRYVYFRAGDASMRQWRIASPTDWKEDTYGAKVPMAGTPAAVAMADGSRRIFYRATDNALHEWWIEGTNWSNAQWGATEAMGGEPVAITGAPTGRDAYYRGKNGLVFRWGFSGSSWSLTPSIG